MASYNTENLEVLSGLEPVKKRPGMYTDTSNPNHLCQEVVDNCIDEALAGYAKKINIEIHADGAVSVTDDGRGIPADIHPEHNISGIEIVMTKLHSGAKFSDNSYQFSGGLHGVGISVVNALSKKLVVNVMRQGKKYSMSFEDGIKSSDLTSENIARHKHGTSIKFWPNTKYFDESEIEVTSLKKLLVAKAVLCPGLSITFTKAGQSTTWCYKDGLSDYLDETLKEKNITPILHHRQKSSDSELEFACAWSEETVNLPNESYVNLIPTVLGGTHVNGLRTGVFEAIKEFCELHELMPRNIALKSEDTTYNLAYILSLKIHEPQFVGQTKEKLSNRKCIGYVSNIVKDSVSIWLNQHTDIGKEIAQSCISRAEQRYRKAKKISRKKFSSGPALPGKLADCICQNREDSELFLVEGDSAGGSAKQARDKYNQAILPLKGKILNTWEVDSDTVLASQTILDIATSIGMDPGCDNLENLRYGKICVLADADSDGNHISTLLCALFFKHFNAVVNAGKLYIAMPPLYRIDLGKNVHYALDDQEKTELIARYPNKSPVIQRFKGLGEMNPSQLKETTMSPASRRLVQLKTCAIKDRDILDMLLAKKASDLRRSWLENTGDITEK